VLLKEYLTIIRGDKTIKLPEEGLFEFLEKAFKKHGDKMALIDASTDVKMTYPELLSKAYKLASFFQKRGYVKGDKLALMVPNCIEYQAIILGALAIGMTFTTCNPAYTVHEVKHWLTSCNARVLFTNSNLAENAEKAKEGTNVDILVSIDDMANDKIVNLSGLLQSEADENFVRPSIDPKEDVAALVYSSGTTGLPKGVMLTHYNITTNILQMYNGSSSHNDSILCLLPMFHIYAIDYVNFTHLMHGACVISIPKFEPLPFLKTIEKYKIETVPIVPPLALFMINHPVVAKFDLSCMKEVVVGAAPIDAVVTNKFVAKFPGALLRQGYGSSESMITHFQPQDMNKQKPGSAGLILQHVEMKICSVETGEALCANEKGEVCLRGPQVMKGYFNNEEATAKSLGKDGWLRTGDLGYYDDEGNVFIIDRLKELIKYKGFQVAPAELEDTLLSHPSITDACVIGIPDERAGQLPRAYLVLAKDSTVTEDDVNKHMEEYMAPHKQLRGGVVFVESIPKSASGKMLRRVLLKEYLDAQNEK
jgi:4-coumarate--CoA ligase